jgi:septum formation protein
MDLVLASTSPYRRALLERLGVPFRTVSPQVDENAIKAGEFDPRVLAERLALAKATSLCQAEPQATLIGSDQVAAFDGRAFGKPETEARAVEMLSAMAGKSHELITAVVVWHAGRVVSHTDITRLTMRPLTRAEIERYVASDRPLDCAGAYKLEARGITLFERIESADHTAITGLPLLALTTILRDLGYRIP